jgi:hypothetical protein
MATKSDIADLRLEIEKVRSDLEVKIADTRADLIKWVVGSAIAQSAAIVALVKLLTGIHS